MFLMMAAIHFLADAKWFDSTKSSQANALKWFPSEPEFKLLFYLLFITGRGLYFINRFLAAYGNLHVRVVYFTMAVQETKVNIDFSSIKSGKFCVHHK